jgi:lincosamide nucleotidyltransferase A/C/D/E
MSRRSARARLRLAALGAARRAYLALARGRFSRVAALGVVQRVRLRWQHPMDLSDVQEILGALSAAGVRPWLAGGWGVDALVGKQTRRHKDLDLVLERADLAAAVSALAALGFSPLPENYPGAERHVPGSILPDRELVQDAAARTVDLHPVDGATWGARLGVDEPFATGTLGGREVGCLSVAAQVVAHQGFELADEHRANIRSIERLTSSPGAC